MNLFNTEPFISFQNLLKDDNSSLIKRYKEFIVERKIYIRSLNFEMLNYFLEPLIIVNHKDKNQMLWDFFNSITFDLRQKILVNFNQQNKKMKPSSLLCHFLLEDEKLAYSFYHFLNKDILFNNDDIKRKMRHILFNNQYFLNILNGYLNIHQNFISSDDILSLFFNKNEFTILDLKEPHKEKEILYKEEISLFFLKLLKMDKNQNLILDILHKNNVDLICGPYFSKEHKNEVINLLITSNNQSLFSILNKNNNLTLPQENSFFTNRVFFLSPERIEILIDFININKIPMQANMINSFFNSIIEYQTNIPLFDKIYSCKYIKGDSLLTDILSNNYYFSDKKFIENFAHKCFNHHNFNIMEKLKSFKTHTIINDDFEQIINDCYLSKQANDEYTILKQQLKLDNHHDTSSKKRM